MEEVALDAARAWLGHKGWEQDRYTVAVSDVQSCPPGANCLYGAVSNAQVTFAWT